MGILQGFVWYSAIFMVLWWSKVVLIVEYCGSEWRKGVEYRGDFTVSVEINHLQVPGQKCLGSSVFCAPLPLLTLKSCNKLIFVTTCIFSRVCYYVGVPRESPTDQGKPEKSYLEKSTTLNLLSVRVTAEKSKNQNFLEAFGKPCNRDG